MVIEVLVPGVSSGFAPWALQQEGLFEHDTSFEIRKMAFLPKSSICRVDQGRLTGQVVPGGKARGLEPSTSKPLGDLGY